MDYKPIFNIDINTYIIYNQHMVTFIINSRWLFNFKKIKIWNGMKKIER